MGTYPHPIKIPNDKVDDNDDADDDEDGNDHPEELPAKCLVAGC